jgi:hypothetical protein
MAYDAVIDEGLDKYRSDSELDAEWFRLDATNAPITGATNIQVTDGNALLVEDGGGTDKFRVDTNSSLIYTVTTRPNSDNAYDLGVTGVRYKDLYLAGNITDDSNTVSVANLKTAYDHSQDNTQAHTDYLINNGDDTTSGTLTAAGYNVNATLDHTITDSSDDLTITNTNQDKDIIFSVNDGGTQRTFVTIDSSNPSLVVNPGTVSLSGQGLIDIQGSLSTALAAFVLRFNPTATGGNLILFELNPVIAGTNVATAFRFSPSSTNSYQPTGFTYQPGGPGANNNITSTAIDNIISGFNSNTGTGTYTITGYKGGAAVLNISSGSLTHKEIALTGGYTITAGTLTQVGIDLAGYGSRTVIGGTATGYAVRSNGGDWTMQHDSGTGVFYFGAADDASIGYDGTDLVIDAQQVGTGDVLFPNDNQAIALGAGAGGDARIYYDGSHLYLDSDAVGSGSTRIGTSTNNVEIEPDGDVVFNGTGGLVFGEIYAYDTSTTITISSSGIANKVQITAFAANGQSNNATPDHTNDHITIDKAGKYLVTISGSIASVAGAAALFGFGLWINNGATQYTNVHTHRNLSGGGGDAGSISMSGICDFAANDTVELWVYNETNTQNIVVDDMTLSVVQIGG